MDSKERSNISKHILRETRSQLRQYRSTQIKERLQAFTDIKNLKRLCMYPVTQKKKPGLVTIALNVGRGRTTKSLKANMIILTTLDHFPSMSPAIAVGCSLGPLST